MTQLTTQDGTPISRFGFGTMQFGGGADETASTEMFHQACSVGINHFDTAFLYTDGASETILGKLVKPMRPQTLVATKIAYDGNGDPAKLQQDFDVSRRRLCMECVDILYLHRDVGQDLSRALAWLAKQQSSSAIRYIGLSNFSAWRVMAANAMAKELGTKIDILQPMYNLVKRQAEVEILPMCIDQGITCAPYSPLGGGLLTGKYINANKGRLATDERYNARYSLPFMHQAATDLSELARELETDPATLAAAWVSHHPAKPIPLLSARSNEQLAPSLAALSFDMTDALYERISTLSPTPPPATDRWEERT